MDADSLTVLQRSPVPQESHRDELFTAARTEKERNNGKAFEREKWRRGKQK